MIGTGTIILVLILVLILVAVAVVSNVVNRIASKKEEEELHQRRLKEEEERKKQYQIRLEEERRKEEENKIAIQKFKNSLKPMQDRISNFLRNHPGETFSQNELRKLLGITTASEDGYFCPTPEKVKQAIDFIKHV